MGTSRAAIEGESQSLIDRKYGMKSVNLVRVCHKAGPTNVGADGSLPVECHLAS